MNVFSAFCNICYKTDNESLKDISQENMELLKENLITFLGHADIIKHNVIYLCQLCCDELTRFVKFRELCLSQLIQLRQMYFNIKSKLELEEDTATVNNTLEKVVHEEVLRRKTLKKTNCTVSISPKCHEIAKSSADLNKHDSVFNKHVINLQTERNEFEFGNVCSDASIINRVAECDEFEITFSNEEVVKNEISCSEGIKLKKFKRESDADFDVSDINNGNERDIPQIEFIQEECELKTEIESSDSEHFTLRNIDNESGEHAKLDIEVSVENNSEEIHVKQENSVSESWELETENKSRDNMDVTFEFVNVCTIGNMQDSGDRDIRRVKDAKDEMNSRSYVCKNKSAATMDTQSITPHVRQHRNGKCSTSQHSGGSKLEYSGTEPSTSAMCKKPFRTSFPYQCTVCNKTFTQSSTLTKHLRLHTGDKPFKCIVCNRAFADSSNLTEHKRIHSDDRPYQCSVCNRAFKRIDYLTKHTRVHSGEKPYKCTTCNKAFTNSFNLTVHERTHSGDRPYKCTVCNKAFAQLSTLTVHGRTHSGNRPYKCKICNKAFTDSSTLSKHERTHTGDRPYHCTVCNKKFTQSVSLTKHARVHNVHSNNL